MSDSEITTAGSEPQSEQPKGNPFRSSFSIWPPTQQARDAVVSRLIETLSTESVLSKRYGVVPSEEAADGARRIEEEAFGVSACNAPAPADVNNGMEILQVYSKEISKRMLETVKSRAESASANEEKAAEVESSEASAAAPEEASSHVKVEECIYNSNGSVRDFVRV